MAKDVSEPRRRPTVRKSTWGEREKVIANMSGVPRRPWAKVLYRRTMMEPAASISPSLTSLIVWGQKTNRAAHERLLGLERQVCTGPQT